MLASNKPGGSRRLLIPALAGLGGLLLLLTFQLPGTPRGQAMLALLAASVIVTGLSSVWLFQLLQWGVSPAAAALPIAAANAIFLFLFAILHGSVIWTPRALVSAASPSALLDLIEVAILLWLVRSMPPTRLAARYLLIPLLTILESLVLVHPAITIRMAAGVVLLAIGTAALLLLDDVESDAPLSIF